MTTVTQQDKKQKASRVFGDALKSFLLNSAAFTPSLVVDQISDSHLPGQEAKDEDQTCQTRQQ